MRSAHGIPSTGSIGSPVVCSALQLIFDEYIVNNCLQPIDAADPPVMQAKQSALP